MDFLEIEFPLMDGDGDFIGDELAALGALSVTFVDRGDEPVLEPAPGEVRLWPDTTVIALFDQTCGERERLRQIESRLGARLAASASARTVADRAWEREWLKDWKPMRFGRRLWVCPSDARPPEDPNAVTVWLDPGLAFGTGTHPTTAQCLTILESMDLRHRNVIDYGCGSGIIAIAALKLGAAHALAVDLDSQALTATRTNAQRNEVSDKIKIQPPGPDLPAVDCVIANILAEPLVSLAPRLAGACVPGGALVLSGILLEQSGALMRVYASDFDIVEQRVLDGWSCLRMRRRIRGPTREG